MERFDRGEQGEEGAEPGTEDSGLDEDSILPEGDGAGAGTGALADAVSIMCETVPRPLSSLLSLTLPTARWVGPKIEVVVTTVSDLTGKRNGRGQYQIHSDIST